MIERTHYESIKKKLEELMKRKFNKFHLEITANKHFSDKLKEKISRKRDLIFIFLKKAAPDLTGYIKAEELYSPYMGNDYAFVVVEVKPNRIKLEDIYQVRKYSELFDARLTLLITFREIPEEIKRLSRIVKPLLKQTDGEKIILARFNPEENEFKEWFPKNPFK